MLVFVLLMRILGGSGTGAGLGWQSPEKGWAMVQVWWMGYRVILGSRKTVSSLVFGCWMDPAREVERQLPMSQVVCLMLVSVLLLEGCCLCAGWISIVLKLLV